MSSESIENVVVLAASRPSERADDGTVLVTLELRYWRAIHAQVLMHRMFARNVASNRARPTTRLIDELPDMVPEWRLAAEHGMQPSSARVPADVAERATLVWRLARSYMIASARWLDDLGVAKELINRLLEPFQVITTVMTGTVTWWKHFLSLRCHTDAQLEIRNLATKIEPVIERIHHVAKVRPVHLPYIHPDEYARCQPAIEEGDLPTMIRLMKISAARCARVSYTPFDKDKADVEKDLALYDKLVGAVPPHASPFEHAAMQPVAALRHCPVRLDTWGDTWIRLRNLVDFATLATKSVADAMSSSRAALRAADYAVDARTAVHWNAEILRYELSKLLGTSYVQPDPNIASVVETSNFVETGS